jgi:hypothetical protein
MSFVPTNNQGFNCVRRSIYGPSSARPLVGEKHGFLTDGPRENPSVTLSAFPLHCRDGRASSPAVLGPLSVC